MSGMTDRKESKLELSVNAIIAIEFRSSFHPFLPGKQTEIR